MMRNRAILLALLIGAMPTSQVLAAAVVSAEAQDQSRANRDDQDRRDRNRERAVSPRVDPGDAARRVSAGREGRMLGIRPTGDGYVVRWEYPGGRVADIRVDGSGRVSGGR